MNRPLLVFAAAVAVSGCAGVPQVDERHETSPAGQKHGTSPAGQKLGVVQMGTLQNAELVFCGADHCPQRTPKQLPRAPAVAQPVAHRVEAAPESTGFKVHFRWGWSRLDEAGRLELERVMDSGLLRNAKQIVVAGRTDPTGRVDLNEKLALRRAATVKAALVKAGVPDHSITAISTRSWRPT